MFSSNILLRTDYNSELRNSERNCRRNKHTNLLIFTIKSDIPPPANSLYIVIRLSSTFRNETPPPPFELIRRTYLTDSFAIKFL